jgi:hypothetical protein
LHYNSQFFNFQVFRSKFGNFLKQNLYDILSCCSANGYIKDFEVLLWINDKYTTLIGHNQDLFFCQYNHFQPGILRFKFSKNTPHIVCHVYQLSAFPSISNPLITQGKSILKSRITLLEIMLWKSNNDLLNELKILLTDEECEGTNVTPIVV